MLNKKLIALLVAVTTVSAISAHRDRNCRRGDDGYMHCDDAREVVQAPARAAGKTGEFGLKILSLGQYETKGEREREEESQRDEEDRERERYYDYR